VADVDRVGEMEMLDDGGRIGGVVVHVETVADLARSGVAAPVMGDDAITLAGEVKHLCVQSSALNGQP